MPGPLDGIRVLDLTSVILGPWATQILGDMGADVIKVEAPGGDATRTLGPSRNAGMSSVFLNANRNKRSVVLDLKQPAARQALLDVAQSADVFVHSMRPAAIERLGLGYAALAEAHSTIIYCATYGYRKDGPYAHRGAYDDLIQGASGLAALLGRPTGKPAYMPTIIADKTVSLAVVSAVTMALFHRERTGQGQEVEVPMFETMAAFTMVEHLHGETFVPPIGETGYPRVLSPDRKPHPTKDGYISVLPYIDKHWRSFFTLIGRPEMSEDARFNTIAARLDNIDTLYAILGEEMRTRTTAAWLDAFDAVSIPAGPVNDIGDLIDEPHLTEVDFWQTIDHPSEGTLRGAGITSTFSKSPGDIRRPAPRLGEHTTEVLRECGMDEPAIAALCNNGAAIQA